VGFVFQESLVDLCKGRRRIAESPAGLCAFSTEDGRLEINVPITEERCRVSFYLPAGREREAFAFCKLLGILRQSRQNSIVTGFTFTEYSPPVLHGYWFDEEEGSWIDDANVWLFIDLPGRLEDESIRKTISDLRCRIEEIYAACGCEQKEFWIISSPIYREM
jgi:hypothetical protein